ncbi:hypothetical protein SNEBB_001149 [Seison nebaliae]|nr:hypothetical protein SNEBB_001149 [Seison nebaliae]
MFNSNNEMKNGSCSIRHGNNNMKSAMSYVNSHSLKYNYAQPKNHNYGNQHTNNIRHNRMSHANTELKRSFPSYHRDGEHIGVSYNTNNNNNGKYSSYLFPPSHHYGLQRSSSLPPSKSKLKIGLFGKLIGYSLHKTQRAIQNLRAYSRQLNENSIPPSEHNISTNNVPNVNRNVNANQPPPSNPHSTGPPSTPNQARNINPSYPPQYDSHNNNNIQPNYDQSQYPYNPQGGYRPNQMNKSVWEEIERPSQGRLVGEIYDVFPCENAALVRQGSGRKVLKWLKLGASRPDCIDPLT